MNDQNKIADPIEYVSKNTDIICAMAVVVI